VKPRMLQACQAGLSTPPHATLQATHPLTPPIFPFFCSIPHPRSSMLHGAMRTAEESKLGGDRYGDRGSAGQYITRGAGGQQGRE